MLSVAFPKNDSFPTVVVIPNHITAEQHSMIGAGPEEHGKSPRMSRRGNDLDRIIIVHDIEAVQAELLAQGAVITTPLTVVPTGRMLYARHADGLHVEYVQWTDELVESFIRVPQREGRLSSGL